MCCVDCACTHGLAVVHKRAVRRRRRRRARGRDWVGVLSAVLVSIPAGGSWTERCARSMRRLNAATAFSFRDHRTDSDEEGGEDARALVGGPVLEGVRAVNETPDRVAG